MDDDATGPGRGESLAPASGPKAPRASVHVWTALLIVEVAVAVTIGAIWIAKRNADKPIHALAPSAGSPSPAHHGLPPDFCRQASPLGPGAFPFSPDGSPEITDITALDRTTARVRWVPKSAPRDAIILVAWVCDNGRIINTDFAPQANEYVFRHLRPDIAPWCFRVQASTRSDWFSHQRCISPPG